MTEQLGKGNIGPKNLAEEKNNDFTVAEIISKTEKDIQSVYDSAVFLKNVNFNEKKIKDYDELNKIVECSQNAHDVFYTFLKRELSKPKEAKSLKDIEIEDFVHTLKQNFSGVVDMCEFFLKADDLKEEGFIEIINLIVGQVEKSRIILKDLMESKLKETEISEINLANYLEEFITFFKKEAEIKEININLITNEITVKADKNKLKSVITNLISNAIKFTNKGGKILIRSEQKSGFVRIIIEDNGVGIPEEKQTDFFNNPGVTTPGTKDEKGTGLGIRAIPEFLKEMDGTIIFNSKVGEGTTFTITLPAGENIIDGK